MDAWIQEAFLSIQKACLPGIWSKAVALSRTQGISSEKIQADEVIARVAVHNRPVSLKVTLWPEDEDWFCDCGDRNEICVHIAAVVIALKAGTLRSNSSTVPNSSTGYPALVYLLHSQDQEKDPQGRPYLYLERRIRGLWQGKNIDHILTESLTSFVGGIQSGRISFPKVSATKEDFALDYALGSQGQNAKSIRLDPEPLERLFPFLAEVSPWELNSRPVQLQKKPTRMTARIFDDRSDGKTGFRICEAMSLTGGQTSSIEYFAGGIFLAEDKIGLISETQLSPHEKALLSAPGFFFNKSEARHFVAEVLPQLQSRLPIQIDSDTLPKGIELKPYISIRLEKDGEELAVISSLTYGNPPLAYVYGDKIEYLSDREVPLRDKAAERQQVLKLQNELNLKPGHVTRLRGHEALQFTSQIRGSTFASNLSGTAIQSFSLQGQLIPSFKLSADGDHFELEFQIPSQDSSGLSFKKTNTEAQKVLKAWQNGDSTIALFEGGFAQLPLDWLSRFGKHIISLIHAQEQNQGKMPVVRKLELLELIEQTSPEENFALPTSFAKLRLALEKHEGIPSYPLPQDLRAELRSYQRQGVNWLGFLQSQGLGALLADDMGLGKTLQSICVIPGEQEKKTLIVAPTSVLQSWQDQIEQFRPSLKVHVYHGARRELDEMASVTLTTYAILRLDRDLLTSLKWNLVILDEAQTIKNPESQMAQAAHLIQAEFRIALSGTPIENRLDDLWSQFQFINPGLLGSRTQFSETKPVIIQKRIRPFILRRLKREVAPELPQKTETILHCELSDQEKDIYQSLMAACRSEVLEKLEQGESVFAALELLLRLRQACCHGALLPGQAFPTSSKTELLMESLTESIGLGHRALVFSQWTSLLDLIEPHLIKNGITFDRLDGSTQDRGSVVSRFQKQDGPSVLLMSLKAGGTGLTLTAADHIYLMDPWWNPAVEDQAADRAHRIGQTQPVLVQRLVAKDTIEDRILALQKRKTELSKSILEGTATQALTLTRQDVVDLLAP